MSGEAVVFVEIPSGSRNKYEYDEELGGIVLDRRLFTAMTYPADYGFVEGTLAEDGDPLDALVLVSDPTFPGCRIRVRAIGVFHMEDEKGPTRSSSASRSATRRSSASPTSTTSRTSSATRSSTSSSGTRISSRRSGPRRAAGVIATRRRRSSPRPASAPRQAEARRAARAPGAQAE